ncbi:UDP-N-acetylglucosamine 1-carboxyvinyltransferase [Christensenella timonensis]|uniref:UDP-N-acetylglucosamine 1-carboxyvinyltransferase n=1 Tax=Christensenella timonensis TaxID=1816678 RepID=UPI000833700E|nr:UDP-N-acetylglucosamine 1-carboxyvinyltransferase [Christensenella timonensis]
MNEKIVIKGGIPLKGTVDVTGAKNAAVAILPATILARGTCVIENLPRIADVLIIKRILAEIGAEVEFDDDGTMTVDTTNINTSNVTMNLVKRMRASYYLLGALLSRFGEAQINLPGGCAIGERPIDQHIKGMEALGAEVRTEYGMLKAKAPNGLVGSDVYLDVVSVGATINIMLAAVCAKGQTSIVNAAKEPHVVDVANFLVCMGAKIKGAGTDVIRITGVEKLHGCNYSIIPDQIETGTLMIAAAATRGDVVIKNVIPTHMEALSAKMVEMGIDVQEGADFIHIKCDKKPKAVKIKTMPYPGFPTDLQQPATVLLSTAEGTSMIVESIFESRFKHISEIRRMGAKVTTDDRVAVVEGVERLTGAPVRATDLRAGAALIVAGLMADGVTEIHNIKYVDRGYDHIEDKLKKLGADIRREEVIREEADDLY